MSDLEKLRERREFLRKIARDLGVRREEADRTFFKEVVSVTQDVPIAKMLDAEKKEIDAAEKKIAKQNLAAVVDAVKIDRDARNLEAKRIEAATKRRLKEGIDRAVDEVEKINKPKIEAKKKKGKLLGFGKKKH
jgi:hypothetical protein